MYTREEISDYLERIGLFYEGLVDAVYALIQPFGGLVEAIARLREVAEAPETTRSAKRQPTRHPLRTEKCKKMDQGYRYFFRPVYLARGRC